MLLNELKISNEIGADIHLISAVYRD